MNHTARKMSDLMKEMSERLLRHPDAAHSSEAAHVALMFANIAWNESVGLGHARESYRSAWETIEADNPEMWNEFTSTDVEANRCSRSCGGRSRTENFPYSTAVFGFVDHGRKHLVYWTTPDQLTI